MSHHRRADFQKPAVPPETAAMKRGITHRAHRVLALCIASCVLTASLVGCDDYGEKKALGDQAVSAAMRSQGRTDDALKTLNDAAGANGNYAAVIQSQQALGQVKLAKANAEAVELARMEAQANFTLARIAQLARNARTSAVLANNYRKLNPELAVKQVGSYAADARGDGNVAQYPVESAKLPTLSQAQQEKSRVDGEVAKAQEAIANATTERDRALSEAGKLSAGLEAQSGEQRAGTVKQIADYRAQAAQASRTITEQNTQLARLQAQQAEQEQLVKQLQIAVESMSAQGTALSQGWQQLSGKAADQTNHAKALLDATEGDSVRSLTKTLNEQLKDVGAKRDEVEGLYKEAIADLGKAADKAGTRVQELNTAKTANRGAYETNAWDTEAAMIAVDRINMDKAVAQKALADLYARRAQSLAATATVTQDVENVSESLNVAAAEPFNGDKIKTELGKAIQDAGTAYEDVLATLEGAQLSDASLAPLKPLSVMLRVTSLAQYADVADIAAANKVAPEVAKRGGENGDLRKNMLEAVQNARANNVPLPTLPMSLGGTPAPTTAPAEGGATTAPAATDDAAVTELRAVTLKMNQALEAGNADEVKQLAVVSEGAEGEVQKTIDQVAKIVHFRKAVAAKFPDDPQLAEMLKSLTAEGVTEQETFKIDGDKAYTLPVIEGETEDLRKVEGTWKPVISLPVTDAGKQHAAQMDEFANALGKIADEVEAGSIADVAQLMQRVAEAAPKGDAGAAPAEGAAPGGEAAPATPPAAGETPPAQ